MLRKLILKVVDVLLPPPPPPVDWEQTEDPGVERVIRESLRDREQGPPVKEIGAPLQKHIDAGKLPDLDPENWERLALAEVHPPAFAIQPIPFGPPPPDFQEKAREDDARWNRAFIGFCDAPPMDVTMVQLEAGDEFVDADGSLVATVEHPIPVYLGGGAYVDVKWVAPSGFGIGRHVMRLKRAPYIGVGHTDALELLVMDEAQGRIRPMFARAVREATQSGPARAEFFVNNIVRAQRPPDGHRGLEPRGAEVIRVPPGTVIHDMADDDDIGLGGRRKS